MSDTIGYPEPGLDLSDGFKPHTSHWGVFSARLGEAGLEVRPYAGDPDPNGIIGNFPAALRHSARIGQPAIRRGWLERGPGPDDRRGRDEFVSVSWERALDLLAGELTRVCDTRGPGAVFGGSYGWSSAGRFHHAQSQVHRFLNIAMGGYVRSVNSYSSGASSVLLPQILAGYEDITKRNVTWEQIAAETAIVLAFRSASISSAAPWPRRAGAAASSSLSVRCVAICPRRPAQSG
jgi:biotin/methionine sulfoxide reductase